MTKEGFLKPLKDEETADDEKDKRGKLGQKKEAFVVPIPRFAENFEGKNKKPQDRPEQNPPQEYPAKRQPLHPRKMGQKKTHDADPDEKNRRIGDHDQKPDEKIFGRIAFLLFFLNRQLGFFEQNF